MTTKFFLLIDGTPTSIINPSQSRSGSNGIEGVLQIPQNSRNGASPLGAV